MHPLGGGVNRVERTLLNFFMRRGVRGGFFRVPEGCFAGVFGVAARHGRAVLPRNSAHGGHRRALGAKKFLKIFKKGVENRKIGVREVPEGGAGAAYIGCVR